ncbi:MAG: GNAT family N-acetyltransferase [Oscillospiraceae bacterium]|nr:GNAT family N-acetyltransferase [Oscillospiraceae bacterium]
MKIDYPVPKQYHELVELWQEAFGDTEEYIDGFFCTAFSPARCRCMVINKTVAAALYWMDVRLGEQRFAYLYAVAVAKKHRDKGMGKMILQDVHEQLSLRGYDGVLLVPGSESLRGYYEKLGYRTCTYVHEFPARAGEEPVALRPIDREEYARLRTELLPECSGLDAEENMAFLETMVCFYRGENLLLAAHGEKGRLWCPEYLGDPALAPAVLKALNCAEGHFRGPGDTFPFAMFLSLKKDARPPKHLALAFD